MTIVCARVFAICVATLAATQAGCPRSKQQGPAPLADPISIGERDLQTDLVAELQDDILKSYERDEPPEWRNSMVDPRVGTVRIGVGPGDVLVRQELERAPSRWPLDLDRNSSAVAHSKRLEIHLARDQTAAWATDEISWWITTCGRTAVIPLRMSALYARDGDRWVPVFEHLSFGRTPTPTLPGQRTPRPIQTEVVSRDLTDELSRVLAPVLRREQDKRPDVLAPGPEVSLIGPAIDAEWHGHDTVFAKILPGRDPMRLEGRLVGTVGRRGTKPTIAYWVGNLTAKLAARPGVPAGTGHFRASFVFERQRDKKGRDHWVIVQGHVSHAIDDENLASAIFGTALISPKPLRISCGDGARGTR